MFSWLGATTLLQLEVQLIVSKDSMKRFCQHWVIKKTAQDGNFSWFLSIYLTIAAIFNQNVYVFKPHMMSRIQVFVKIIRPDPLPRVWSLKCHQQDVYGTYFEFCRFDESCFIPFFQKTAKKSKLLNGMLLKYENAFVCLRIWKLIFSKI